MQSYQERSSKIAEDSSIAVMVLLNPDATDLEFLSLVPQQAGQCDPITREDFTTRKLRPVGIIGLCGTKAECAFKEAFPDHVMCRLGDAFLTYVRVLLGKTFMQQWAAEVQQRAGDDFVEFVAKLYAPDPRPEKEERKTS